MPVRSFKITINPPVAEKDQPLTHRWIEAKQTRWEVTVTVRGSAAGGYDFTGP